MSSDYLFSFFNREVDSRGALADREEPIFDILRGCSSCLDVEVLKHPMKPHVRNGLFSGGESFKTGLAPFFNPRADISLFEFLGVNVSEALELIFVANGLGHRDLRVLGLNQLSVLASLIFGKLELFSLFFYVKVGFQRECFRGDDRDPRFLLPLHEGSLS